MPELYIIAGCNGAGKTTTAYTLLPDVLQIDEFVNADEIAHGLSPFNPESVAFAAGRIMLGRIKQLISKRKSFVIESTLATKTYRELLLNAKQKGYQVIIVFLWLKKVEIAISRVKQRVAEGGHDIPIDVIRRRYTRGKSNFLNIYQSIATYWMVYDNSGFESIEIAKGTKDEVQYLIHEDQWKSFLQ